MHNMRFYMPPPALASYIERIYVYHADAPAQEEKLSLMLPAGTGLEFVYHLKRPFCIQGKTLPTVHTICQRQATVATLDSLHFISVRFRSGRFRHFTNTKFSELNNQYLSSENLWESDDVEVLSQVHDINAIEDKVSYLYSFFAAMLDKYFYLNTEKKQRRLVEWDSVIDDIYYHADSIKLHDLLKKYGMSQRQFERGFKTEFGVTAKHFIKDFKSAIGMRPKDFFVLENFKNHFYFPSVSS